MNWKQRLFKPKWQHKDAEIRLAAVATEQDPDFINSLVEIAGNDSESRVRCAAIKRLHQLANILPLYAKETDAAARALLEERIRQLAASSDESRPALELRLQVAYSTSDRKLIEHLASHAPEAELRRAALAKVKRQGLLGDCCIEDNDSGNRHFAASRITQHTTLKRVIDALRKRDKKLHTQLQTRLHEELLEKADPDAVHSEAILICSALEHLAIETGDKDNKAIDLQHAAWKHVEKLVTPDVAERYLRVCERLAAPPASTQPKTPVIVEPKSEPPPKPETVKVSPSPSPDELKAKEELAQAKEERQAALEKKREQNMQALSKAEVLLDQLAEELEQGELHKALETRLKIQKAAKENGKNDGWKSLSNKMAGMNGRLRELREWHHWSNDKIRKRLIAEMEVLPAADLHPDALLDRVKSLQAEWKSLEQSEQIPGEKHFASSAWMWRKFSAAGHTGI